MNESETTDQPISRRQNRQKRVSTIMQWLGYPTGGLGIAGTIALLKAGQPILATVTALASIGVIFLAIASKFFSNLFNRILDKIEEKLEDKVEPLANYIVEGLEDSVVKTWWKLTAKFEGKYYQQLIYDCRDYQTFGLKTKGEFTFELEKIFVPLRVCPESLGQISHNIIATQKSKEGATIWDFLVQSKEIQQFKRIAIIGAPGSGKTTLLTDLTLTYAQNRHRRQNKKAPKLIPILIYLRDVRDLITQKEENSSKYSVNENVNLVTAIVQQKSIQKLKPRENWFEELLQQNKCLVMLDGLDEVADDEQRKAVSQWVNQQINNYRKANFILTSRPFGYKIAPVENVTTILDVQPFNLTQMDKFIHNWYLQREIMSRIGKDDQGVRDKANNQAEDLIDRIKNNPNLASLALNPLLLTMIATVHCYRGALPGRRVELYGEICDVLLGRRDEAKGININLTPEQQKAVLQVLAFRLMEKETREFTLELGCELIENELKNVAGSALKTSDFIKNIEKRSGLLIERENNLYEFAHKSFQEYLTAVEIKESNQEAILSSHLNNSWWEETIRLYAAQTDATNLIQAALKNPDVNSLKLALDCCDEALKVNAQVKENLYEKIEKGLESFNQDEFELAVNVQLKRRLSNLLRVDETLEIDREYIICAEYQLFFNNYLQKYKNIRGIDKPNNWKNKRFPFGDSQKPVTGINWENANMFCAWLSQYFPSEENLYHYRLLRPEERENYPSNDDSWLADSGIRIATFQLPSRYRRLSNLLASQNWQEADEETLRVMLEVANCTKKGYLDIQDCQNFPREDLRIIDQLWLDYSNRKFGFSVQKQIWLDLGGKIGKYDPDTYQKFADTIGWRKNGNWLSYNEFTFKTEDALLGHLPSAVLQEVVNNNVRWRLRNDMY